MVGWMARFFAVICCPALLTAPQGGGASDAADVVGDDEGRVNEELADLDGDELRRVASSLEVGRL